MRPNYYQKPLQLLTDGFSNRKVKLEGISMKGLKTIYVSAIAALLFCSAVVSVGYAGQKQFVPNNRNFWDDSINWTTNYGPAYRDVTVSKTNFLPCDTQFALCFHSGPDPLPCKLSKDGRSAECTCTVSTEVNYTLITAILNYKVYQDTINFCSEPANDNCQATDSAPVCSKLDGGKLIPGAKVISTFDTSFKTDIFNALDGDNTLYRTCDKGPYAGCMTAPCKLSKDGQTATCKCPVFHGRFQLVNTDAACQLGGGLVNSASYNPILDTDPNQ
jgi:hypothetical protein